MAKARKTDDELLKQLDEFETNQKTLQRESTVPGIGETISNWLTPAMTEGQKAQRLFKANELEYGSGASEAPLAQPYPGTYGPRQTPAQAGVGLGNIFADFLANMPKGSVAQNVAAATMGAQAEGIGQIVNAAASINPNQDLMNEYNKTATLGSKADGVGQLVEAVSGTMQGQTPPMSVFQHQDVSNDLKAAGLDSPWGALQQTRETQSPAEIYGANANVAAKAKTAEAQLQAFTGSVTGQPDTSYVSVKQANARTKLKSLLSSGRPMGVQEIADLIKEGGGPGAANAYETALKLNTLQKERIKTMNPADFQNYGDAFQHAQLNGMNMSEALKFASDWSRIAPQGQQSSSQASPRESGLYEAPSGKAPAAVAERWAAEAAAHKTARDVAQRIREGIKPQPAPAPTPTTPPAATPTRIPKREREAALDAQTALLNDLKIDAATLANASTRIKQPIETISAAVFALTPAERAAYKAITDPDARMDALNLIVTRHLKRAGKAPSAK